MTDPGARSPSRARRQWTSRSRDDQEALRDAVRGFLANEAPSAYVRDDGRRRPRLHRRALGAPRRDGLAGPARPRGARAVSGSASSTWSSCSRRWAGCRSRARSSRRRCSRHSPRRALGADELLAATRVGRRCAGPSRSRSSGTAIPIDRVRTRARRKGADWVVNGAEAARARRPHRRLGDRRRPHRGGPGLVPAPDAARRGGPPRWIPRGRSRRLVLDERRGRADRPARRPHRDLASGRRRRRGRCSPPSSSARREAALQLAVEYAKVRVQFDRPMASFQAIRHKAVDMLHRLELARVGTHYAAWASDVDDPAREHAAAMAKGFVGEAAVFVTSGEDIQIHGGVGFTWDCDAHFYYKRAKQNDADARLPGLAARPSRRPRPRTRLSRWRRGPTARASPLQPAGRGRRARPRRRHAAPHASATPVGRPRRARSCASGGGATRASRSSCSACRAWARCSSGVGSSAR